MTVAIPLASQSDYTELRYALRSIEKFVEGLTEVVIIGSWLPDWIVNVTWVDLADIPNKKQLSIRRKILAALEYAPEIFFTNDDIYLLKPVNPLEFPYYYTGELKYIGESGAKPALDTLTGLNKPLKHFDSHYPLLYDMRFNEALNHFSEGSIIKSAYCNYWNIEGVPIADSKIIKAMKPEQIMNAIKDKPCFSTGQYSINSCKGILQNLFPSPSRYELG